MIYYCWLCHALARILFLERQGCILMHRQFYVYLAKYDKKLFKLTGNVLNEKKKKLEFLKFIYPLYNLLYSITRECSPLQHTL